MFFKETVIGIFSGGWSPESTLKQVFKDLKAEGIDGVKKHLTENALKKLNNVQAWTDYPLFDIITKAVAVELVKEGTAWKIDSLNSPKLD